MAGEPDHLSPAASTVANLPLSELLAHMHGQWRVAHPHAEATLARLDAASSSSGTVRHDVDPGTSRVTHAGGRVLSRLRLDGPL